MAIVLAGAPIDTVCRQGLLHFLPEIVIDNRLVLAWIGLVPMHGLAAIYAVLQHVIERSPLARCGISPSRQTWTQSNPSTTCAFVKT